MRQFPKYHLIQLIDFMNISQQKTSQSQFNILSFNLCSTLCHFFYFLMPLKGEISWFVYCQWSEKAAKNYLGYFVTWFFIDNEGGNMLKTIYWFKIQYLLNGISK